MSNPSPTLYPGATLFPDPGSQAPSGGSSSGSPLLPARPHFAFPFTRTATGVKAVEQGSSEHILAQANVVAYCPLGYREDRPEFGWPWPDLQLMPVDASPLLNALKTFGIEATLADAEILAGGVFDIEVNVEIPPGGDTTGAAQEAD